MNRNPNIKIDNEDFKKVKKIPQLQVSKKLKKIIKNPKVTSKERLMEEIEENQSLEEQSVQN